MMKLNSGPQACVFVEQTGTYGGLRVAGVSGCVDSQRGAAEQSDVAVVRCKSCFKTQAPEPCNRRRCSRKETRLQ